MESGKQMTNANKLPDDLVRMVEEFDRFEKVQYPLKSKSFRDDASKTTVIDRLIGSGISRSSQYFKAVVELDMSSLEGKFPRLLDPIEFNGEFIWMNNATRENWGMPPGYYIIASDELGGGLFVKREWADL
jgi:hypothetical protein